METIDLFLKKLGERGWKISLKKHNHLLNEFPAFRSRINLVPKSYLKFLDNIDLCVNSDETVWFLSVKDFIENSDSTFRWNEFELQSRESSLGDMELVEEIDKFWIEHIPIAISVKGYYSYLGISISKNSFGKIVCGSEPEYEETVIVGDSFEELISNFVFKEIHQKAQLKSFFS